MHIPHLLQKSLLTGVLSLSFLASTVAQEISLLASETGIIIGTSLALGDGQFTMSIPSIINQDIWKPVKPEVKVIDDNNLILNYPNGAEIKVSIAGTKIALSYANIPAEATRILMGFSINREAYQGSKFSFKEDALTPFPEEDTRRILFEGKAKVFTIVDPAGVGLAISGPDRKHTLTNKGPEGWSQFGYMFSYVLAGLNSRENSD